VEYLQAGWKWLERKRTQQLASRRLRLAETISLGEKRSVSIVQVDGAQFLIGCSAGSVQLLAVLDKQHEGNAPLADTGGAL
jgi:flagellar biogenesis protein FliO